MTHRARGSRRGGQAYGEWALEAKNTNVAEGRDMAIPTVPTRGLVKKIAAEVSATKRPWAPRPLRGTRLECGR